MIQPQKWNEALTAVTTWMTLENTMLRDRSQNQVVGLHSDFIQNREIHRERKLVSGCQGPRGGGCGGDC